MDGGPARKLLNCRAPRLACGSLKGRPPLTPEHTMQTFKFLALPVVGIMLWLVLAAATITRLESMARTTQKLQQPPAPVMVVTASR